MMDVPYIEGDYSYKSDFKYGSRFAMVGDSGQFIDPIFSSGVYLSMKSATLVSARLHEMLTDGDMDHDRLSDVYVTIDGAYGLVKRLIETYYNPHTLTFAEVGPAASEQKGHEVAMAAGHYFLTGDFFENQARYQPFLSLLSNPRDFGRFKQTIIDRHDRRESQCELAPGTVIYPDAPDPREVFGFA